jgi:tRNA A37 threonylcarbamoyladenosine synthetase subunit TsaC/SUA5/YrdC
MVIKVKHSEDHPDVKKIADIKSKKMKKKLFSGVGKIGDNSEIDKKVEKKATKKAKEFMDSAQTILAKQRSETEGSFAKGGRAMLRGGGICKKGMNKKAIGRNS